MAMTLQGAATARPFAAEGVVRSGRLFLLEMSGDRIHSMNPDGSDCKTMVTGCHLPDGIVVDSEASYAGPPLWVKTGNPQTEQMFYGLLSKADLARRSLTFREQRRPRGAPLIGHGIAGRGLIASRS
jgi:hypothetical protein